MDVPLDQLELLGADGHAEVAAGGEVDLEGARALVERLADAALAASIEMNIHTCSAGGYFRKSTAIQFMYFV